MNILLWCDDIMSRTGHRIRDRIIFARMQANFFL